MTVLGCSRSSGRLLCSFPCYHTTVAFTASRVSSPQAPALRQEVEARLAKGALGISLGPGPGFTVVISWWNRPLTAGVP